MPRRFTDYEIGLRMRSAKKVSRGLRKIDMWYQANYVDLILEAMRDIQTENKELKQCLNASSQVKD